MKAPQVSSPELSPAQMLAARNLLGWSRDRFAARLEITPDLISKFEKTGFRSRKLDLVRARGAIEAAGVDFIEENGGGAGVRLRRPMHPPKAIENLNASNDE